MASEPRERSAEELEESRSPEEAADRLQEHPDEIGTFVEAVRDGKVSPEYATEVFTELADRSTLDGRTGLKNEVALLGSKGTSGDIGKLARQCEREAWFELRDLNGDVEQAKGKQFAMVVLDLDDFKLVNEEYGQERGDRLLEEVGAKLSEEMRPNEEAYRLGGGADEFALVLPDVATPEEVKQIVAAIGKRMPIHPVTGKPVQFNERKGIAIYDTRVTGPDQAHAQFAEALQAVKGK